MHKRSIIDWLSYVYYHTGSPRWAYAVATVAFTPVRWWNHLRPHRGCLWCDLQDRRWWRVVPGHDHGECWGADGEVEHG